MSEQTAETATAESAPLGIGSRLWEWDGNRRVYARDERGRSIGGPIPSEHYVAMEIVAETKLSWIVARPGTPPPPEYKAKGLPWGYTAVDKKTQRERGGSSVGYGPKPYFTDAQREEAIWLATHHRKILALAEKCKDVAALKHIGALLGYREESPALPPL